MVSGEHRQIQLPNIFIPKNERRKGYDWGLLKAIRSTADSHGYDFWIVDMVPSFHQRMLKRNAIVGDDGESVLVVSTTNLD
jgi:hypothetical protein